LWASRPAGGDYEQPYFIGVQLNGLVPDRLHSLNLFDAMDGEQSRARLLKAMDELNNKYGLSTLAPATMLSAYKAAPTRIAFSQHSGFVLMARNKGQETRNNRLRGDS